MPYTKVHEDWEDLPSTDTPVTAAALEQIEEGVADATTAAESAASAASTASAGLASHLADTSDAHDASAISTAAISGVSATNVQDALAEIQGNVGAGGYTPGGTDVAVEDGGTGASTAAGARTNLGLGTIATQNADAVTITGGSISNIGDLAVEDGGTGASNAGGARTNLGAAAAADLTAHIDDTAGAHAASAISYVGGTGMSATDVEAAIDELATEKANWAGGTFTGDIVVPAEAYGSGWNGSNEAPTKNDVYDEMETRVDQGTQQIWVPAEAFSATSGSPAMGTVGGGRYRAMLFDGTSTETIACSVDLPSYVTAIKVDVFWTNAGAGSGGVGWSASLDRAGDGETLAASAGGGSSGVVGASSVAQDVLDIHTLIASVGADESKLLNLRISRNPSDASDTLANDAALLGVRLLPL